MKLKCFYFSNLPMCNINYQVTYTLQLTMKSHSQKFKANSDININLLAFYSGPVQQVLVMSKQISLEHFQT